MLRSATLQKRALWSDGGLDGCIEGNWTRRWKLETKAQRHHPFSTGPNSQDIVPLHINFSWNPVPRLTLGHNHAGSGLSSSVLANRKNAAWFCDVSWLVAQFNFAVGSVGIGQNMASKTGIGQNMACQTGSVRPNPWQASFKLIRLFWWDSSGLKDEFLVAEFPTP